MIKIIIFDLWSTLGKKPSSAKFARELFGIKKHAGYLHDYELADHMKFYKSYETVSKDICRYFGIKPAKETVGKLVAQKKYSFRHARMLPGMKEVVRRLSKDYRIILISNTNNIDIKVLDKWGIRKYFYRIF